jgi:GDP-L-fucose synthase
MKILVTGGTGMLGRNICEAGAAKNLTILAPSRKELDLSSPLALQAWLATNRPDVIIHAAGHVGGIQANVADPFKFLSLNVDMAMNLIRSAHVLGISRFLNIGSSCMYPREAPNPLKIESLLTGRFEPTNEGYAIAKVVAGKLCEYIAIQSPDYLYKTLIPCNLYGRYDHFEPERSHLVPAVIKKVHDARMTGASSISLWGDGSARREFMFAADAADLILEAAQRIEELPQYLNIGLGHDFSVLEYYQAAARIVGWDGEFQFDLTKPTGMKQKLLDVSVQSSFGWAPRTTLHEGLLKTYEYFHEVQRAG